MSDTQGASDPGTATGGLENDMPGIGNAPANPRTVPSGLGGLANFAQQILGIGGPAPRAPGPGRSPFQYPGQSQIPQQRQPPVSPNAPRWEGTTGSLFLPRGSEQPPSRFSPFKGTVPTGNYRSWGQPEQFPELPQSFELPGLYKGLGQFFGQQGGTSGPLGLMLAGHADAYIKGVIQGQEFRAKMAKEQLLQRALELQEKQELQHTTYADRMREYFELAGEDKAKAGTVSIKGVDLRNALHNDALKLGDTDFANMIENGATFDQLMRYQDFRDARLKDLQKANDKASQQAEEDKATWGMTAPGEEATARGGAAAGADPFAPSQERPPSATIQTPRFGGDPSTGSGAPTLTPQGQQQPTSGSDFWTTPNGTDTPSVQEAIREAATGRGQKVPGPMGNYITQRSEDLKNYIKNNILKNPNLGPDTKDAQGNIHSPVADALDALGGNFGDDSTALTYYRAGLGGGQTGGGGGGGPEQNYNSLLRDLARKRRPGNPAQGDPGWQQRNYQLISDFEKNTQTQQTNGRLTNLATTGRQLQEAIDNIPTGVDKGAFATAMRNFNNGVFTGDPRYVAVAQAWNNYNIEKNTLLRGGVGGIGETRETEAIIPKLFERPEDFRVALVQDAENVKVRADQIQKRYHDLGGEGDYPGFDRGAYKVVSDMVNVEPINNKKPGDRVMIDGSPAIWRGVYDENGKYIPPDERYQQVR